MASSGSEDFESADEDIAVLETSEPVAPLKSDVGIGLGKQTGCREITNQSEESTNAQEMGLVGLAVGNASVTDIDASFDTIDQQKEANDAGNEKVALDLASNRKQRQQKQREHKINTKPKKLGTKITYDDVKSSKPSNIIGLPNCTRDNEFQEKYVDTATEDRFDMDTPIGLEVDTSSSTPKPDPYEKFKGFSVPPRMEQCWEDGVDNNTLYGIGGTTSENKMQSSDENLIPPSMDSLSQAAANKCEQTDSTWGSWGGWGVTSLLSTATEGVSTLTSHVSSVLESGIGAPNPEELAWISKQEKLISEATLCLETEELNREEPTGLFNFGRLMTSVSSISKLVETTGSKVISGGLDTLETIGKKTMEVLQEGDPGLKKKRAMFSENTVLSQVLREAKERAEVLDKIEESRQTSRHIHFETLFDEFQGLIYLEALEMLSKQCDLKLQSMLLTDDSAALRQFQGSLKKVKESCHLPDEEDMSEEEIEPDVWWTELANAEKILSVSITADKFSKIWNETKQWLKESIKTGDVMDDTGDRCNARDIHKKAVSILAELTAMSMELFHKGAELLLVKELRNPMEEAVALKRITSVLCSQVSTTATDFCERLNSCPEERPSDSVNALITNVFLEASNSSSYIQEAFQLLVPVLQVGVTF